MKLQRVRLQNFRQHVDSTIEFNPGLTGIIGPNGAGKSTILEGIAWAIYGSSAARGTNDTIRFARAAPRAKVIVDLQFELEGHEYRVTRTLSSADLFLDNGVAPVATGVGGVTAHLQNKLGMNRQEFFNTYFTGQKELQFLAQMGATERGRFLAQVLGYERLRKAQNLAADRRRELKAQIEGVRAGLPDPQVLTQSLQDAETRTKEANKALAKVGKQRDKLIAELQALTPKWVAVQVARERAIELTRTLASAQSEFDNAQRDIERIDAELKSIAAVEKELKALKPQLQRLKLVAIECEKMEELARLNERRLNYEERRKDLVAEIAQLKARLEQLQKAPDVLKQTQAEHQTANEALAAAEPELEQHRTEWNRNTQDVKTQIRLRADNERELELQIQLLKQTGGSGKCPVCTRPLEDEFDTVYEHLEDELEKIRQNVKWLKQREKQLVQKPAPLVAAEQKVTQLREVVAKKRERESKCEQAVTELWERTNELRGKEKQLTQVEAQLAELKEPYDPARHDQYKAELAQLRAVEQKARVYEHDIDAREKKTEEHLTAKARATASGDVLKTTKAQLKELKFNEESFTSLKLQHEALTERSTQSQLEAGKAENELHVAEEALAAAQRAQAAYEEKRVHLTALESDLRHHNEMDAAVAQLRGELNARVRPELSELASTHLSDITDGRYNALEIDDNYNVLVLEDGEEKPVISGGEEDVANLVLRIAISQMIAERAGQTLSTLFLDEVFGSLDQERRDNVIQLLQKLRDRFEQMILITHVETVREGLDHVIRLEYDERSGASLVKNEIASVELPAFV
jgi:exonuclease SbcC